MGDSADMKYCTNCKRDIAAANFVMHELHCQRNITLCKQCNEPYPRSELDDHIEEVHAKISCPKCSCDVEKADIEKHEKELCSKRIVKCAYCELDLPHSDLTSHMDYCGTRTEQCHKCSQFIMHKDLNRHEDSNCQYPPKEEKLENNARSDRHSGAGAHAGLFYSSSRHGADSHTSSFVMKELDRMLDLDLHRERRRDRNGEHGSRSQIGAERATQKTTNASSKNKNSLERSRQNKSNLTSRNINLSHTPKEKTPKNTTQRKRETDLGEGLRNQNPSMDEDHRIAMHLAYDLGRGSEEHDIHNLSPYEPELSQSDELIIPCEFCGEQFPTDVLFQHQSVCSPFQSRNEGLRNIGPMDDARISPPLSPSPVLINDSSIPNNSPSRSAPRTTTHRPTILDNLHSEWEPNSRSDLIEDEIMLPCEFCDEQFPLDILVQHQSVCDANGSMTPIPVIKPKAKPPPKPRMPSTTVPSSTYTSRSQRRQQDPIPSYLNDTEEASAKTSLRSNGAKKTSKKSTSEQRLSTGTTPINLNGRYTTKPKPERKHSADAVDIAGASGKYESRHRGSVKVQETLDRLITDPTYTTQDLLAHIDLEEKQEKSRLNEKQRNELDGRPRNRSSRKPPTSSSSSSQASSLYQPDFVSKSTRPTKKPASKRNQDKETEDALMGITGSSRVARSDRAGARDKKPSTRPRNYPQGDM